MCPSSARSFNTPSTLSRMVNINFPCLPCSWWGNINFLRCRVGDFRLLLRQQSFIGFDSFLIARLEITFSFLIFRRQFWRIIVCALLSLHFIRYELSFVGIDINDYKNLTFPRITTQNPIITINIGFTRGVRNSKICLSNIYRN